MSNLIERLEALTIADGKEIGSYREGTGLRGENDELTAIIERLEIENAKLNNYMQRVKDAVKSFEALDKEQT